MSALYSLSLQPCSGHLPPTAVHELPPANESVLWILLLYICYYSLSVYPLCYNAEVKLGIFAFWHLCGNY